MLTRCDDPKLPAAPWSWIVVAARKHWKHFPIPHHGCLECVLFSLKSNQISGDVINHFMPHLRGVGCSSVSPPEPLICWWGKFLNRFSKQTFATCGETGGRDCLKWSTSPVQRLGKYFWMQHETCKQLFAPPATSLTALLSLLTGQRQHNNSRGIQRDYC